MTLFVDGKVQRVQKWLDISENQDQDCLPEKNYDRAARIWRHSLEIHDEMSDAEILTMLQGPVRSLRKTRLSSDLGKELPSTDQTMTRYSSTHTLISYYFLFQQDPYGRRITKATISLPSLKCEMPFYEYSGQYCNRKEWFRILGKFIDIDFHKLGQRQQDEHALHSPHSIWEAGSGNRKIARISSSSELNLNVWYGPVKDWEVVFEFEGEYESTDPGIQDPIKSLGDPARQVVTHTRLKSALLDHENPVARIIKQMSRITWLYWAVSSITLHYLLYDHIFQTSNSGE